MKKVFALIIPFCLLVSAASAASAKKPAPAPTPAAGINWMNSLDKGLAAAKESKKPLMVDFYAEWCGWCKKLDKTTYNDPKVVKASADFVCVKVDTDADSVSPSKYGVQGLPTIVFMNSKGEVLDKIVGYNDGDAFYKTMTKLTAGAPAKK